MHVHHACMKGGSATTRTNQKGWKTGSFSLALSSHRDSKATSVGSASVIRLNGFLPLLLLLFLLALLAIRSRHLLLLLIRFLFPLPIRLILSLLETKFEAPSTPPLSSVARRGALRTCLKPFSWVVPSIVPSPAGSSSLELLLFFHSCAAWAKSSFCLASGFCAGEQDLSGR